MPTKTKQKTIPIKPSKTVDKWWASGTSDQLAWTRSPPFCINPRGVLTHRVRHVTDYYSSSNKRLSHHHCDYLCGNGCNIEAGATVDVLTDDPGDRLICNNCERRAAELGLPDSDKLAGRHVHRGVMVPKQVCHTED